MTIRYCRTGLRISYVNLAADAQRIIAITQVARGGSASQMYAAKLHDCGAITTGASADWRSSPAEVRW